MPLTDEFSDLAFSHGETARVWKPRVIPDGKDEAAPVGIEMIDERPAALHEPFPGCQCSVRVTSALAGSESVKAADRHA